MCHYHCSRLNQNDCVVNVISSVHGVVATCIWRCETIEEMSMGIMGFTFDKHGLAMGISMKAGVHELQFSVKLANDKKCFMK